NDRWRAGRAADLPRAAPVSPGDCCLMSSSRVRPLGVELIEDRVLLSSGIGSHDGPHADPGEWDSSPAMFRTFGDGDAGHGWHSWDGPAPFRSGVTSPEPASPSPLQQLDAAARGS